MPHVLKELIMLNFNLDSPITLDYSFVSVVVLVSQKIEELHAFFSLKREKVTKRHSKSKNKFYYNDIFFQWRKLIFSIWEYI